VRWILALNPRTFIASATAVSIGAITAYYTRGEFSVIPFLLTLLGITLAQGGVNLINDYYDYLSGVDVEYRRRGPGHRLNAIIDLNIGPSTVSRIGYSMLAAAVVVGTYLALTTSLILIVILIVLGLIMGIGYSAPPLRFRYRGLGELLGALALGPLSSLGSYVVQVGSPSVEPLVNAIPNACFAFLALIASGLLHYDVDAALGKRTLVVIMGPQVAIRVATVVLGISYASLLVSVILDYLPSLSLIYILTLPLALRGLRLERSFWGDTLNMRLLLLVTVTIAVILR